MMYDYHAEKCSEFAVLKVAFRLKEVQVYAFPLSLRVKSKVTLATHSRSNDLVDNASSARSPGEQTYYSVLLCVYKCVQIRGFESYTSGQN